jgi:hypothetical protein
LCRMSLQDLLRERYAVFSTHPLRPNMFVTIAIQIVETNSSYFALDRKITPEATQEVILQSIEKLLEKDSPSLEMYVIFFRAFRQSIRN